jgi:NADH-quinone oxidoreductase subunit M
MLGVFMALDLFLFYVMWEVMLIPMYFIVGIWGGERRLYASIKFFIYTMVGSLLMLVAIIYLGLQARSPGTGLPNFNYDVVLRTAVITSTAAKWLFGAFFLAFAVKVPMFPFHTWLPDAHVKRRPPARWFWRASCSSSERSASFASPFRFFRPLSPGFAAPFSCWR